MCNMEIEIVTLIVKGSTKLSVPTDWQDQIQVGNDWSVAPRRVLNIKRDFYSDVYTILNRI